MSKKIKWICAALTVVILVCAGVTAEYYHSTHLDTVSDLKVSTDGSTATLNWSRIKHADSYTVYQKTGDGDYTAVRTVQKDEPLQAELPIEQTGCILYFTVEATADFGNQTFESTMSEPAKLAIAPQTLKAPAASSTKLSIADIAWSKTPCSGYELAYTQGEFTEENQADAQSILFDSADETSASVTELTPGETYSFRVRPFLNDGEDRIWAAWSEATPVKIRSGSHKIDKNKPMIALTFDDGPNYKTTSRLLDLLEKYDARATFFMVGNRTGGDNAALLKRELELGCELGNHTYDHTHYGKKVTESDIKKGTEAIKKASGEYPTAFRCPGGTITDTIRKYAGTPIYYWSVDTQDWKLKNAKKIYENIMQNTEDGDIILMHDIYETTIDAVEMALPKLAAKGFQFVTVSELMEAKGIRTENGKQYFSAASKYNGS